MSGRETPKDTCAAKIAYRTPRDTPSMRTCGQECEYLTAEQARARGMVFSGWYHVERMVDHHAVPKVWVS